VRRRFTFIGRITPEARNCCPGIEEFRKGIALWTRSAADSGVGLESGDLRTAQP
jgi:hypothetical protein